jgi:lysophospholipase L1-like esterase
MRSSKSLLVSVVMTMLVSQAQAQAPRPMGPAPGPAPAPAVAPIIMPPAEVPAAVVMPRPTAAEVDQVRAAIARLGTTDPQAGALLRKFPDLIEVRPPRPNSAIAPALSPQFQAKHQANIEVARAGQAELLLMGDSITDFWRNEQGAFAGKAVLDKNFGQWKIANFGIAGDTTQGVLYRLNDGEGRGIAPRAIMLMIGTNNTGRNTAGEIAEGIGAVVLQLRRSFPQAKILLLAVFPRGAASDPVRGVIADINQRISKLHDGTNVHYLDIGQKFLDAQGEIPKDVMSDGLHPGAKGYEIWADAVREPLTRLMAR